MNLEAIPLPILGVQSADGAKDDQKLARKTDRQSRCVPLANHSVLLGASEMTPIATPAWSRTGDPDMPTTTVRPNFQSTMGRRGKRVAQSKWPSSAIRDAGAGISQSVAPRPTEACKTDQGLVGAGMLE